MVLHSSGDSSFSFRFSPLLVFPSQTFHLLFSSITLDNEGIRTIFSGVWVCFSLLTYSFIPISYVLAFKDTKFSLFMGGVNWCNGFLLMYVVVEFIQIPAIQFWLWLGLVHATTALIYYARMQRLKSSLSMPSFLSN